MFFPKIPGLKCCMNYHELIFLPKKNNRQMKKESEYIRVDVLYIAHTNVLPLTDTQAASDQATTFAFSKIAFDFQEMFGLMPCWLHIQKVCRSESFKPTKNRKRIQTDMIDMPLSQVGKTAQRLSGSAGKAVLAILLHLSALVDVAWDGVELHSKWCCGWLCKSSSLLLQSQSS